MKIFFYCQHVLGIGHFFRSLEICKGLMNHEVTLITGGPRPDIPIPDNVKEIRLPGLMMDAHFSELLSMVEGKTVEQVKKDRVKALTAVFEKTLPDIFIIELYPFGRKSFRFELDPLLKMIKKEHPSKCRVVCSLRDILVEKKNRLKYENRVIGILNRYFDALLVHSDPSFLKLDETFHKIQDIRIPIFYTGFVTPKPSPGARKKIRKRLRLGGNHHLVVASAGGGKVGAPLLDATIEAVRKAAFFHGSAFENSTATTAASSPGGSHSRGERFSIRLEVFTGPFMDREDFYRLKSKENRHISVQRFTPDFLDFLAAADLSVSMGGYNTCMNILAAETVGLVFPFSQNREQRLRVKRLSETGRISLLDVLDLQPDRLAQCINQNLLHNVKSVVNIDLQGSENTARWLKQRSNGLA